MSNFPLPDRRTLLLSAAGLLAPGCSRGRGEAPEAAPSSMRCTDFLETVGVNTHLSYSDSQYNSLPMVLEAIKYVGLRYVRDSAIDRAKPNSQNYGALAAAGISFCLYWGPRRDMDETVEQIGALAKMYPGSVCGLEGPNELKPALAYAGLSGNDAAQAFMSEMRRAKDLRAVLRQTPLVSFTSYAPASSDCDFANAHPYPKMGKQPAEVLAAVQRKFVGPIGVMPGRPMMFTEFGYHTLVGKPSSQGQWQGVSPEVQACLILNGLLDGASLGISRIYLYQLLDGQRDAQPGGNAQHHFGLFNFDGSPKPAAHALKTLLTLLRDDGLHPRPSAVRTADTQIDGSPWIKHLSLTHSSGRHFLALWNEAPLWDSASAAPIRVAPAPVTITLSTASPVVGFDLVHDGRRTDFGVSKRIVIPVGAGPVVLSMG